MAASPVTYSDWRWDEGVAHHSVLYTANSDDDPSETGGALTWIREVFPENDDRGNGSYEQSTQTVADFLAVGPPSRPPASVVVSLLAYIQKPKPAWFDPYCLLDAAVLDDLPAVQALLARGVPADGVLYGTTAFVEAIQRRSLPIAETLFAAGVDVNRHFATTDETILPTLATYAPDATWEPLAARIVAAGADIEARTIQGFTPLMAAASAAGRLPGLVGLLLRAGADVNARSKLGYTALIKAAIAHHAPVTVIEELLDAGAEIEATDEDGVSALMWAISGTAVDAVRCLVAAGADVHRVSAPRDTRHPPRSALQLAESYNNPEIVACIREACRRTAGLGDAGFATSPA